MTAAQLSLIMVCKTAVLPNSGPGPMILKARAEHISLLMAKEGKGDMEGRCQKHKADS